MTEFFTIKHIDNSRLVRPMAPNRMRECARLVLLGGLIALCAFLYAWQHFQAIQLRYQLESLRGERSQAAELNQELKLEVAGLRAPRPLGILEPGHHALAAAGPGLGAPIALPPRAVFGGGRRPGTPSG